MTLTAQAHPPQPAGHAPGTHSSSHAQAVIVGHHLGAAAAAHSSHVPARHHHAAECMGSGFRLKCRVIKASRVQQQQPTESSGNVILSHVVRQQQQHLHVASLSHTNTQTHAKRCKRHCKKHLEDSQREHHTFWATRCVSAARAAPPAGSPSPGGAAARYLSTGVSCRLANTVAMRAAIESDSPSNMTRSTSARGPMSLWG